LRTTRGGCKREQQQHPSRPSRVGPSVTCWLACDRGDRGMPGDDEPEDGESGTAAAAAVGSASGGGGVGLGASGASLGEVTTAAPALAMGGVAPPGIGGGGWKTDLAGRCGPVRPRGRDGAAGAVGSDDSFWVCAIDLCDAAVQDELLGTAAPALSRFGRCGAPPPAGRSRSGARCCQRRCDRIRTAAPRACPTCGARGRRPLPPTWWPRRRRRRRRGHEGWTVGSSSCPELAPRG